MTATKPFGKLDASFESIVEDSLSASTSENLALYDQSIGAGKFRDSLRKKRARETKGAREIFHIFISIGEIKEDSFLTLAASSTCSSFETALPL